MKLARAAIVLLAMALPFWCVSDSALAADTEPNNCLAKAKPWKDPYTGAIDRAGDVDWLFSGPTARSGAADMVFVGTIMGQGGLNLAVYRAKKKNAKAAYMGDLVLVSQSTLTKAKPRADIDCLKGYYYYFRFKAAVPGRTGTYAWAWW